MPQDCCFSPCLVDSVGCVFLVSLTLLTLIILPPLPLAEQWWCTPLSPELGRQKQADFWVRVQPGLQSEFKDSQGDTEKPCLKKRKSSSPAAIGFLELWGQRPNGVLQFVFSLHLIYGYESYTDFHQLLGKVSLMIIELGPNMSVAEYH